MKDFDFNNMRKSSTNKKLVMAVALVISVIAIGAGATYAYFAAAVTQGTTSQVNISAVSGLSVSFANNSDTINATNVLPGQSWQKTFSAAFTNKRQAVSIKYSIVLDTETNSFDTAEGKLKYTLTGDNVPANTTGYINSGKGKVTLLTYTLVGDTNLETTTKSYTLTIEYPNETNREQTQGGSYSGSVYFTVDENRITGAATN